MRKRLALTVLGLLGSTSAAAQSNSATTRTMTVDATVPRSCTVGAPTLQPSGQVNFKGLNGSSLQIDQLVDPTTLSTNAASIEVHFEAICNLPHRLKIETQNNGLWQVQERGLSRPSGFANAIPYRARLDWSNDVLQLNADARVRRIAESSLLVSESRLGDLRLRLDIDAGSTNVQTNAPIIAGSYGDTLRIFLEPQQ
jgi:hypothetical protein